MRLRCSVTRLGRLRSKAARRTSHPQLEWIVATKASCLRLIELLDQYPLRGRKSRDYAVWRPAVLWWAAGNAKQRQIHRDWTPMAYLKDRLGQCKTYAPWVEYSPREDAPSLTDEWLWFFSGFATAEAHIGITANGPGYLPRFQITLRDDDFPLLRELRRRLDGIGRLYRASRPGSHPSVTWMVRDIRGLRRLVDVFDRFPPRGRKRNEYEIWRRAVFEYATADSRPGERLLELRQELLTVRTYPGRPSGLT
jgi:hypothetical protein